MILRVEPLAKVLDAHRQGCRVRSCGVCSVAAQCRILRHRRKHESSPLAAAARNGVFGEVFKRGQQDARMFLSDLFAYLARREPCVEDLLGQPDFISEYGARSVVDDCLFGCVFRLRKRCLVCGATGDVLQNGVRMVTLDLLGNDISDLSGLWALRSAPRRQGRCPREGECNGAAVQQTFLEKEPPFVLFHLQRSGQVGGGKVRRAVSFPQTLGNDFFRSGSYTLAGVVLHWGATANSGHYTAICRTSPAGYHLFDDGTVRASSWSQLTSAPIREAVYLLLYVRDSGGSVAGHAQTSYVRGRATQEALGDLYRDPWPAVGTASGSAAASSSGGRPADPADAPAARVAACSLGARGEPVAGDAVRVLERRLSEVSLGPVDDVLNEGGAASSSSAPSSLLKRQKPEPGRETFRRARVVSGFGDERVDDVVLDEERRVAAGIARHAGRQARGERGRMTDRTGADLDRSAGAAWYVGKRS